MPTTSFNHMAPIPPVPQVTLLPPSDDSTIQTSVQPAPGNVGAVFGRSCSVSQQPTAISASIAPVSISDRAYNGPIFDSQGNRLN